MDEWTAVKYNGRYIQVKKLRKDRVLIGEKLVERQIYIDENGVRYIRQRDGLKVVAFRSGNNGVICYWYYEIV